MNPRVFKLAAAGATALVILSASLDGREGNVTVAYKDGRGKYTICRGLTTVNGKPVTKGMKLTAQQCAQYNAIAAQAALTWVDQHVAVPLTDPQRAGIASFCPYSIGPGKCLPSTFLKKLNAGDTRGACAAIKQWIWDGGHDCRIRANNCYGQIDRRNEESELTCWGLDESN